MTENCSNQKDYFDSRGNYLKTICLIKSFLTKESARKECEAQQMVLASGNDFGDSEALLINRASGEIKIGVVWIGGEANGLCSTIESLTSGNFIRSWKSCTNSFYAYCEFNGKKKP